MAGSSKNDGNELFRDLSHYQELNVIGNGAYYF